jgi:hypothetical protein
MIVVTFVRMEVTLYQSHVMNLHFKEQVIFNTFMNFCLWKRHWLTMASKIFLSNCAVDALGIRGIRPWKLVTFYLRYLWHILWPELWSQRCHRGIRCRAVACGKEYAYGSTGTVRSYFLYLVCIKATHRGSVRPRQLWSWDRKMWS